MLACLIFLEKIQLTGINVGHLYFDYFKSKEKSFYDGEKAVVSSRLSSHLLLKMN